MREQVRERYAAAAQAVTGATGSGRTALQVVDADQCCLPSADVTGSPAANVSCCGAGGPVDWRRSGGAVRRW